MSLISKAESSQLPSGVQHVDLLAPKPARASVTPVISEWKTISTKSSGGMGGSIVFQLPQSAWVSELVARFSFSATSAGNLTYPAINAIESVRISSGGRILMEYNFVDATDILLSTMDEAEQSQYIEAAGGSAVGSAVECCAVIPTWFSKKMFRGQPYFCGASNEPIEVELRMRELSDLYDSSGAGSGLTSANLDLLMYDSTSSERAKFRSMAKSNEYVYPSFDIQTIGDFSVGTSASTHNINQFNGNIQALYLRNTLASLSDNERLDKKNLTSFELKGDHSELYKQTSHNQAVSRNAVVSSAHPGSETLATGNLYVIPFTGSSANQYQQGYHASVGLSAFQYNSVQLVDVISATASCTLDVAAVLNATFVTRNGTIEKKLV